jgi:sortase A
MRYRVQVLGWALIWSGLFVFGYLGWQIFVTDFINAGVQREAAGELEVTLDEVEPAPEEVDRDDFLGDIEEPSVEIPEVVEYFPEDAVEIGESFAFLTIPQIGLDGVVVYEGVDGDTLKKGPGHMERTPLPGQPGNAVISGHRTTHGRPFFDFDMLAVGDRVEVETATGTHVYEIRETLIVDPTDVWVTDPRPGGWLTMTTCNPKFSARERLIVFAEMVAGRNLDYINLHEVSVQAS